MPPHDTITSKLPRLLDSLAERKSAGGSVTLGDLVYELGSLGPPAVILVMAFPFLTPVSLGPLTLPSSIVIFWLATRIAKNSESVGLPKKYLDLPLPNLILESMRSVARRLDTWAERRAAKRKGPVPSQAGRTERLLLTVHTCFSAVLLGLPIPILPLSNTLPTLGIILGILAFSERRRAYYVPAVFFALLSTAYFGALFLLGTEVVVRILEAIGVLDGGAGA